MSRVKAQAGTSLADIYDVVGSVAGVDELDTRSVPAVHEMGNTIFSERLGGRLNVWDTQAIAQTINFGVEFPGPDPANAISVPTRILGAAVTVDVGARVLRVAIVVRDITNGVEFPIFVWDEAVERIIRMQPDTLGVANVTFLQGTPEFDLLPSMIIGSDPDAEWSLFLRGTTAAFGLGSVTVSARVYLALARTKAISSLGLPIPGW